MTEPCLAITSWPDLSVARQQVYKWMKIDGGFECLFDSKIKINSSYKITNQIKFFQAFVSSISDEKDPQKKWRKMDVKWEQMFTAHLNKYVLFNFVMKFIYDRDMSKGGQFFENTSIGLSYKFDDLKF